MSRLSVATFPALGTTAVVCTAGGDLPAAVAAVRREVGAIDLACSRFRDDSELVRLNRSGGRPVAVGPLLLEALTVAVDAAAATDGDVDPTVGRALRWLGWDEDFAVVVRRGGAPRIEAVPAAGWHAIRIDRARSTVRLQPGVEVDLGSTAKALAADRCARAAAVSSGGGALVGLGGDLAASGPAPAGGWPVRVTDDHRGGRDAEGQDVAVTTGGLATSSTTVRRRHTGGADRHHIVDPRTGLSAREVWRTVSVAARTCLEANVESTAAIVRGETAVDRLAALGLPARLVRVDGRVVTVSGWPS